MLMLCIFLAGFAFAFAFSCHEVAFAFACHGFAFSRQGVHAMNLDPKECASEVELARAVAEAVHPGVASGEKVQCVLGASGVFHQREGTMRCIRREGAVRHCLACDQSGGIK